MTVTATPMDVSFVDTHVQDNYRQVRLERGWTWEQLAEQFERDNLLRLAVWARLELAAEQAPTAPVKPRRGRRPGPDRTATPNDPQRETRGEQVVVHPDGSVGVPAAHLGALPDVDPGAYGPDAVALEPTAAAAGDLGPVAAPVPAAGSETAQGD